MARFFSNIFSPHTYVIFSSYTYVYGAIFCAAIIVLSFMMRWAERDIREARERMKSP